MNTHTPWIHQLAARFSETAIHFLWQGALIATIAGLLVSLLARRSPRMSYAIYVGALLAMAGCVPITWSYLAPSNEAPLISATPSANVSLISDPIPTNPPPGSASSPTVHQLTQGDSLPFRPFTVSDSLPFSHTYLMGAYLLGLGWMMIRLTMGLRGARNLRLHANPVDDHTLLASLDRLSSNLAVRTRPAIAFSRQIMAPVVVGIVKPMILLPASVASHLTPAQLEIVIAHELAHLKRYDHLVLLGQRMIEALLFFHPAVWWISRRLERAREHCCDDIVLASGAKPADYAESLVVFSELQQASLSHEPALQLAATGTPNHPSALHQRVLRILGQGDPCWVRLHRPGLLTLLLPIFGIGLISALSVIGQADGTKRSEQTTGRDDRIYFGPAIVLTLDATTQGSYQLDLDTGKTFPAPPASVIDQGNQAQRQWVIDQGIDLAAMQMKLDQREFDGVLTTDLVAIPVDESIWRSYRFDQIKSALQSATPQPIAQLGVDQRRPITYAVKTREGRLGLLQILEAQANSQLKLRYQMVKQNRASHRQRFVPRVDDPSGTNWTRLNRASYLPGRQRVLRASVALKGSFPIGLSSSKKDWATVTMLEGDDSRITLRFDGEEGDRKTVRLWQGETQTVTLDGRAYRVTYPSVFIGLEHPDHHHLAHVSITYDPEAQVQSSTSPRAVPEQSPFDGFPAGTRESRGAFARNVEDLEHQIAISSRDLENLEAQLGLIEETDPNDSLRLSQISAIADMKSIKDLKEELDQNTEERELLNLRYLDRHPKIRQNRAARTNLLSRLSENVSRAVTELRQQKDHHEVEHERLEQQLLQASQSQPDAAQETEATRRPGSLPLNLVVTLEDEDQAWFFKDIERFEWNNGALEIKGQRRYFWEKDEAKGRKAIVDFTFQPFHKIYPAGSIRSIEVPKLESRPR